MRGIITDALQGEPTHVALIDARLDALASRMTAAMPGTSLSMTWNIDRSDVEYTFTGFGRWLERIHDNGLVNLAAAAASRMLADTGLSRGTIASMAAGADFEKMPTEDFHILAAICEAHFEDVVEARMDAIFPDQRTLSAHAARMRVATPLPPGGDMPLGHLTIDRDLLAVWMEDRPALSIVRDIRASMMDEIGGQPWHGAIDPVRIEMIDGAPTLVRAAQISTSPDTHYDGTTLMVEQDLPETLLDVVEGRIVGDVVETGRAGIDGRTVLDCQENSRGFEVRFAHDPVRLGEDREMARALERELRDDRPEE